MEKESWRRTHGSIVAEEAWGRNHIILERTPARGLQEETNP